MRQFLESDAGALANFADALSGSYGDVRTAFAGSFAKRSGSGDRMAGDQIPCRASRAFGHVVSAAGRALPDRRRAGADFMTGARLAPAGHRESECEE